jgi:hypothetical protein
MKNDDMSLDYDYHSLSEALLNIGAVSMAAELQAFFCGQLCVKPAQEDAYLLSEAEKFLKKGELVQK